MIFLKNLRFSRLTIVVCYVFRHNRKKSLSRVHKIQTLTWILEIKTLHVWARNLKLKCDVLIIIQQIEYIFILTEMR